MRNSPGYPYNKGAGKGKFPYFTARPQEEGKRVKYDLTDLALKERLAKRLELAKQGVVIQDSIWLDVIKDELRPLSKVKAGSSRLVNAPPLDLMILANQYFGAFRIFFLDPKNVGLPTNSAMGCDPKKLWPDIGPEIKAAAAQFGIDYEKFDASQDAMWQFWQVTIINRWYQQSSLWKKEDDDVRMVIFFEIAHTLRLLGTLLYWGMGWPSGVMAGLTTIGNILVNMMISRIAFVRSTKFPPELYNRYIRSIFMGDDNAHWIPKTGNSDLDQRLLNFNRITLAAVATEVGMKVTMPDKSPDLTKFDKFEDFTFLKSGFGDAVISGYFLPTMDKQTIGNLLNWFRPKGNPDQLRTNLTEALKFAAPHGRAYYDELRGRLSTTPSYARCLATICKRSFPDTTSASLSTIFLTKLIQHLCSCKERKFP
jgi:hypothetical protein